MRFLAVMLLCAACHEVKTASFQEVQTDHDKTDSHETEFKFTAPVDTDTVTTRQDNALLVQEPDGTVQVAKVTPGKALVLPKGSKVVGTVPLATVETKQEKHQGPVTDTKGKEASHTDDKNTQIQGHEEDTKDTGFSWKFYLTIVLLAALGIGGVLLLLKYKLWRPL